MERVLLIHGLWMPAATMHWLARRLRAAGFDAETLGYYGAGRGPQSLLPQLQARLADAPAHLVAHSLGGLAALVALETDPGLPVPRVVCLGSPLCGSDAARGLQRHALTRRLLGHSAELLSRGCTPWRGRAQVGAIAGATPLGLGRLFGRFDGPSDGTVAVAETRLEGLADHVVIPASHSGLPFSPRAADLTVQFLRHGRFQP
ncbi:MAG TPA: alpha/beta hydrolase [Lysobacter sp.]|nr:alpha/beta hydrolase [Lysobacter sp.]